MLFRSVYIHTLDNEMLQDSYKNAYQVFYKGEQNTMPAEKLLVDGEYIDLDGEIIKVIHTRGHTNMSLVLRARPAPYLNDMVEHAMASTRGKGALSGRAKPSTNKNALHRRPTHTLALFPRYFAPAYYGYPCGLGQNQGGQCAGHRGLYSSSMA